MRRKGLVTLSLVAVMSLLSVFSSFADKLEVAEENLKWKYLKDDGTYAKSEWIALGKDEETNELRTWKYFDENGYGLEGEWLEYNGQFYYFDDGIGDMQRNEFVMQYANGEWKENNYYSDDFFQNQINKAISVYYVGSDGTMLRNQWNHYFDKYWFYFGEDGKMLRNTTTPDGYTVDDLGRWTINGVIQK